MVLWEIFHAPRTLIDALNDATAKELKVSLAAITPDLRKNAIKNGCRPLIDSPDATPKFQELLKDMWQNDPSRRPSISEVATRLFKISSPVVEVSADDTICLRYSLPCAHNSVT
jgi:hypothetical protein